eukprot:1177778-Prorocentrum_minimum.AAC.1
MALLGRHQRERGGEGGATCQLHIGPLERGDRRPRHTNTRAVQQQLRPVIAHPVAARRVTYTSALRKTHR